MEFDSPDTNNASLNLTITLFNAVDTADEWLNFTTEGTGVTVQETGQTGHPDYTLQYVLRNASTYSEYEQASAVAY